MISMISQQQRKELTLIKPPKYRLKVQKYLQDKGVTVSISFIGQVYLGTRESLEVAKAICTVFAKYQKDKDSLKTNIVVVS